MYAISQFIPFDPFLVDGIYCSAAAPFLCGVPFGHAIGGGVPTESGHYPYLPGEREGLLVGRRLQLSHCVAGKICFASRRPRIGEENTAVFCLDPQILACLRIGDWRRLLPLSQSERR
jgi:hypothetical protein